MKKIVLSLLCAGVSFPASASALPSQAVYNASVITSAPIPVGQIVFSLDANIPLQACRYFYEWNSAAPLPASADGYVLEAKVQGHANCAANSLTPFVTTVVLDSLFPAYGFDGNQQFRLLIQLILGENANGNMNGTIQYGASPGFPTTMVNSFRLRIAG